MELSRYLTRSEAHCPRLRSRQAKRRRLRNLRSRETPSDGEFGAGGKNFYFTEAGVAAVQVLDPAPDKIVAEIPTGVSQHFVDLFDGTKLGLVVVQGPGQFAVV
jgi:hypothetical protein